MAIIDKLAWIHLKEKSILTTRTSGKDKYYIPGGKREFGEYDCEALIREISEELSINLNIKSLKYFGTFEAQAHGHPDGVLVKMTCYMATYSETLKASSEIEEIKWLKYNDRYSISEVDKIIFDYLKDNDLLE